MKGITERLMRYESGEMTSDLEVVEFFQELIDSVVLEHLQGHYHRTAAQLVKSGDCHYKETDHVD